MKSVSIVLPTFNGIKHLPSQFESYLSQTRLPDEIVIIDDGSDDGTWELVKSLEREHPDLVQVFRNESNLGVTKNFERGIKKATGDVLFLSDQDDVWAETKVERQLEVYRDYDVGLVCHDAAIMGQTETLWERLYGGHDPLTGTSPRSCINELTLRNFAQGASIMIDADLKEYMLPIPTGWMYDHFLAYVATATTGLIDIPDTLLRYRQHEAQERGAAAGVLGKAYAEWKRPPEEYRKYVNWWTALRDRLAELDPECLQVDREYVLGQLDKRVTFNRHRAAIHDPGAPLPRRLAEYVRTLEDGGYFDVGHTELAVLDLLAAIAGE